MVLGGDLHRRALVGFSTIQESKEDGRDVIFFPIYDLDISIAIGLLLKWTALCNEALDGNAAAFPWRVEGAWKRLKGAVVDAPCADPLAAKALATSLKDLKELEDHEVDLEAKEELSLLITALEEDCTGTKAMEEDDKEQQGNRQSKGEDEEEHTSGALEKKGIETVGV